MACIGSKAWTWFGKDAWKGTGTDWPSFFLPAFSPPNPAGRAHKRVSKRNFLPSCTNFKAAHPLPSEGSWRSSWPALAGERRVCGHTIGSEGFTGQRIKGWRATPPHPHPHPIPPPHLHTPSTPSHLTPVSSNPLAEDRVLYQWQSNWNQCTW